MATNVAAGDAAAEEPRDDRPSRQPSPPPPPSTPGAGGPPGFFAIYKKGQGYWTRMGTALGAAIIGGLVAHFLYTYLPAWGVPKNVTIGITAGFLAAYALFAFWMMNKPANADFLIATDSEMKKVNWTSRKELFGSTRVVIAFMLLIALFLFIIDTIFGYIFYFLDVLKFKPF